MTQVNYAAMSDQELKQYMLSHRDDQTAFQSYMDRRNARPNKTSIAFDDPDWEEKVLAAIQQQVERDRTSSI